MHRSMSTLVHACACAFAGALLLAAPFAHALPAGVYPPVNPNGVAASPRAATAAHAAIAAPAAASATAAKPIPVLITDDDGHAPYKEGGQAFCSFAGACTLALSTVPAGHRRIVEHFSCLAQVAGGGQLQSLTLVAADFSIPRIFIPFVQSGTGFYTVFLGNIDTSMSFEAGQAPLAYAFSDNIVNDLLCTATGRDITLP